MFNTFAQTIPLLTELDEAATGIAAEPAFPRFGITDVAILRKARGTHLVLTTDFRLSQYLAHQGVDVFNFNHLRSWLLGAG